MSAANPCDEDAVWVLKRTIFEYRSGSVNDRRHKQKNPEAYHCIDFIVDIGYFSGQTWITNEGQIPMTLPIESFAEDFDPRFKIFHELIQNQKNF